MIAAFDLTTDADAAAEGSGVQIHVDITQIPTIPPVDGLAATGVDMPLMLIIAAVILIAVGMAISARRVRLRR